LRHWLLQTPGEEIAKRRKKTAQNPINNVPGKKRKKPEYKP